MIIKFYIEMILVFLFVLTIFSNAWGQEPPRGEAVAKIHKITDLSSGKPKIIKKTTDIVEVQKQMRNA